MGQSDAQDDVASKGCMWGFLGALALGLALLVLGWNVFGRLCLFLALAAALVRALRDGSFHWIFTTKLLRRHRHPIGYWAMIATHAALALFALWMLVQALRQGGS